NDVNVGVDQHARLSPRAVAMADHCGSQFVGPTQLGRRIELVIAIQVREGLRVGMDGEVNYPGASTRRSGNLLEVSGSSEQHSKGAPAAADGERRGVGAVRIGH